MVTYKILKQCHKDYDALRIQKQDLLFDGGTVILKHAEMFLPRDDEESEDFYQERLRTAYDPIFTSTIERFKSLLFLEPLSIVATATTNDPATPSQPLKGELSDFIQSFEKDCNGNGKSLQNFAKDAFLTSLKQNHCITLVDFPRVDVPATNLQDQLDSGALNGYLVDIPLISVIDWDRDDLGNLTALKIFTCKKHRDSIISPYLTLYKWITIAIEGDDLAPDDKRVVYHIYEKDYDVDNGDKPLDDDNIPEVETVITSFQTLNIAEMCLSNGLALGSVMTPACEELYRIDSIINAATQRNVIFSLPILKAGDNISVAAADGRRSINAVQMDTNRFAAGPNIAQRRHGWMLIGKDDDAMVLETEGKGLQALQDQKKVLIERINSAVHAVAQNIQARGRAQAESAAAKVEDRRDTETVLSEMKLVVEHYIMQIIGLLLSLRGESDVSLTVQGLNVEDQQDRILTVNELIGFNQFPEGLIGSEIFNVNFLFKAALSLAGDDLENDDKIELRKQIEDSVKKVASDKEEVSQANLAVLKVQGVPKAPPEGE
jgi:hypothetical protein